MTSLKNEPVIAGALTLLTSFLALLIAFGVHLTDLQTGAVSAFAAAVLALAGLLRSKVTPTANIERSAPTAGS